MDLPGEKLLAGARFALDQDFDGRCGDLANALELDGEIGKQRSHAGDDRGCGDRRRASALPVDQKSPPDFDQVAVGERCVFALAAVDHAAVA